MQECAVIMAGISNPNIPDNESSYIILKISFSLIMLMACIGLVFVKTGYKKDIWKNYIAIREPWLRWGIRDDGSLRKHTRLFLCIIIIIGILFMWVVIP